MVASRQDVLDTKAAVGCAHGCVVSTFSLVLGDEFDHRLLQGFAAWLFGDDTFNYRAGRAFRNAGGRLSFDVDAEQKNDEAGKSRLHGFVVGDRSIVMDREDRPVAQEYSNSERKPFQSKSGGRVSANTPRSKRPLWGGHSRPPVPAA